MSAAGLFIMAVLQLILIVSSTTRTDDWRRLQRQDHIVGLEAQRKPFACEKRRERAETFSDPIVRPSAESADLDYS